MHNLFLWIHDDKNRLLMKVKQSKNRLYKILLNEVDSQCLLEEATNQTWCWHARKGHVNFTTLKQMSDEKLAIGLPKISIPTRLCNGYLAGKQKSKCIPNTLKLLSQEKTRASS